MSYTGYAKGGCYCCHDWHIGHRVVTVPGGGGIGVKVWCTDCQVLGDVQAVGHSIGVASSSRGADCATCEVVSCPSAPNRAGRAGGKP